MKKKNTAMIKKQRLLQAKSKQREIGMKKEATDEALMILYYTSLLVLRDKFGFGRKRLERFMGYAVEMLKDISNDRLSFIDIRDTIYEETGFEIELIFNRRI